MHLLDDIVLYTTSLLLLHITILQQSNEKNVRAQSGCDTDEKRQSQNNAGTQNINIDSGAYIMLYVYTYLASACRFVPP